MKKLLFALLLLLSGLAATLYFFPATQLASLRLIEQYRAGLAHEQLSVHNLNIHYYQGGPASGETPVSYTHLDVYQRQGSALAACCASRAAALAAARMRASSSAEGSPLPWARKCASSACS